MKAELIAKARQTNLVEYFCQRGFKLIPVKSNRGIQHKVSGYGGLYVKDNMFYRFSDDKHGNAIECLTDVFNYNFKDAVLELTSNNYSLVDARETSSEPYIKNELVMPDRCANIYRVYAYLLTTRYIEKPLVSELLQKKLLYQDIHGNAVFVHRDKEGNKIGGELQGTSEKRFKGIVPGTQCSAFELSRGTPKKVRVFESAIDMLSYMQINKKETDTLYASMAGLKKEVVFNYHKKGLDIISMVDNDVAGEYFNNSVKIALYANNLYKDFNNDNVDSVVNYEVCSVKDIPYSQFVVSQNYTRYYISQICDVNKFLDAIGLSGKDYSGAVDVFVINDSTVAAAEAIEFNYSGVQIINDLYSHFKIDNLLLKDNGVKDWNDLLKKNAPLSSPDKCVKSHEIS